MTKDTLSGTEQKDVGASRGLGAAQGAGHGDVAGAETAAGGAVQAMYREAKEIDAQILALKVRARTLRIDAYKLGTGFDVGDRVEARGYVYEITKFACRYDRPLPVGRKVLKDGGLHAYERDIDTWGSVRKVANPTSPHQSGTTAAASPAEHLTAPTRRPSHSPDVKDTQQ